MLCGSTALGRCRWARQLSRAVAITPHADTPAKPRTTFLIVLHAAHRSSKQLMCLCLQQLVLAAASILACILFCTSLCPSSSTPPSTRVAAPTIQTCRHPAPRPWLSMGLHATHRPPGQRTPLAPHQLMPVRRLCALLVQGMPAPGSAATSWPAAAGASHHTASQAWSSAAQPFWISEPGGAGGNAWG